MARRNTRSRGGRRSPPRRAPVRAGLARIAAFMTSVAFLAAVLSKSLP